jgi:hypothetical protein
MPRNITVTFGDGSQHVYQNAPDSATPESVTARAQQEFNKPVTKLDGGKESSFLDTAIQKAKLFGSDVVKGVAALPALALDLASIDPTTGKPPTKFGGVSSTLQNSMATPATTADKWQSAVTQGIAGGLAGPGGVAAPIRAGLTGAGGGAGSEIGGRLTNDSTLGRLAGALLGGVGTAGVAGKLANASPQITTLAHEAMEGLTPDMLKKAQTFQSMSNGKGVEMDLAQALEGVGAPAGNLTTIRNVLANNRSGNAVQETLRQQPGQLEVLADTTVGGLPGQIRQADVAANNMQAAATGRLQQAKTARSDLWADTVETVGTAQKQQARDSLTKAMLGKDAADLGVKGAVTDMQSRLANALSGKGEAADFLEAVKPVSAANATAREAAEGVRIAKTDLRNAKSVPPETVLSAASDLQRLIAGSPNTGKATALARLQKSLFDPATEAPITDPKKLNEILTSEANKLKSIDLASSGVDAGTAKWIGSQIQGLRDKFGESFAPIREANKQYARVTKEVIDPLKQSGVGQFATPRGFKPDVAASQAKLVALFNKGEDPMAKGSNIRTLAAELKKVDPEAFPDAFKTYLSGKLGESFAPTIGGAQLASPDAAEKVFSALFSNRNQWNGLRQGASAAAESFDLPPAQVVKGLESFAQITKALRSRPATVGGLQREEVFQLSGKSYGADALRVFGFLPFEQVARRIEDATMAKTLQQFDKILTTPEGAAKLAELGKVPPMSGKALAIFSTIGAATATADQ